MTTPAYARSACGECGEPIYRATIWLHVASDQARCYRDPHTETAYPDQGFEIEFEPEQPAAGPTVLGFLVQCVVCPQKALVDEQPEGDWTCPRCAEVAGGFGDVDVAAAERPDERQNRLIGDAIDIGGAAVAGNWGADEWWLGKVRG